MNTTLFFQILLQFFLIFLNAVFACAEIAVLRTGSTKLEKLALDGNRRARRLLKLTENPAKFLATIQVAITLSGFLGSAFAADNFSDYIVKALDGKIPVSASVIETVSVILITLLLSFITLVFGELVPKRLAMQKSEKIALGISGTVGFISVVFAPIVWLLTVSTNGLLRLMKINPEESEAEVSEEDIRMMADAGSEKGTIDEEENKMIQNVFEFDDITVGEIATHRTEMTILWDEDSDADWLGTVTENIESFYPVCGETADDILGILNAGIYLRLKDKSRRNVMENAVFPARFVAQVMKADVLFREMKRDRSGVALVVDEYGGTYGIITMNDLIEQIVGELDEGEDENDVRESAGGYFISGSSPREDFDELFDVETGSDSATIGGWLMEKLEKIPEKGDSINIEGVEIEVTKADDKRVLEIFAKRTPKTEPEE